MFLQCVIIHETKLYSFFFAKKNKMIETISISVDDFFSNEQ